MQSRFAVVLMGCLCFAGSGHAADRKPAYDPAQWTGTASQRTGGTLGRDLSAPATMLPGTLSGSVMPAPSAHTPAALPAPPPPPEPPSAPSSPSLDPWREPRTGAGRRPWGEIPPRFQSQGESGSGRRLEPPVIVMAPPGGYLPGQLPGGNALSFPFGYTPGGYGADWLMPGLGYGTGLPGGYGLGWPGVLGGWPFGLGSMPFGFRPFFLD